MQRLTVAGRLLITALIIALIYLGLRFIGGIDLLKGLSPGGSETTEQTSSSPTLPGSETGSTNETEATDVATDNGGNTGTTTETGSNATSSASRADFNYTPPAPTNGKLKGVVELGASGFNSFIINVDAEKRWKLDKAEFGNSLVLENMATDVDIREGLKKYIGTMLDHGVSGRDIHFVVSSGAQKADNTIKIIRALKTLNYNVNTVTPEQEGRLALRCVLPADYAGRAFVADIGSGNTKISWTNDVSSQAVETYGSKFFQEGVANETVATEAAAKAKQVPANKREVCFIIGGIPFELAKQVRNGKERYTVLKAPAEYTGENAKQKAGLVIYKALADGTGCRQFVFDWDANFTIGFLLTLK